MDFHLLTIPSFTQHKYSWAEIPGNANISSDFPKCPSCARGIGQLYWLAPFDIVIRQPKTVGDFVGGIINTDLVVSENFKTKYEASQLTGIEKFFELNVVQMGTKKDKAYSIPKLFGAIIKKTQAQVDYTKMNVKWFSKPKPNMCTLCCPGGGGDGGICESYSSIAVKNDHSIENDFFIPINFIGNIMLKDSAKDFI